MHDFQATFGDLVIDGPAWEVRLGGAVVDLTRTEFQILLVLASRPRRVVTDDEVVRAVWGDGWFGDDNNLAVHVSKLRHKLGESGLRPRFIRTVRGVGYRFDPSVDADVAPVVPEPACERLRRHPNAVDVRTDGQLRVTSIRPEDALILGFEPRHLLGRYFPVVGEHPWDDHASALAGIEVLISSGVREWTARHVARRADGSLAQADVATCLTLDDDGRLAELHFVLVERGWDVGGGGGFADLRTSSAHAPSVRA